MKPTRRNKIFERMNYKKWDDMAKDLSDSDDESKKKKVRVTRLGQSSQVSISLLGLGSVKNSRPSAGDDFQRRGHYNWTAG